MLSLPGCSQRRRDRGDDQCPCDRRALGRPGSFRGATGGPPTECGCGDGGPLSRDFFEFVPVCPSKHPLVVRGPFATSRNRHLRSPQEDR